MALRQTLHSLIVILVGALSLFSFAENSPFANHVADIEQRLDSAMMAYQNHQITEARQGVQMAYFEVFENLEGPIRINFSAKKSYQMEATFGKIRKMMGKNASVEEIQIAINGLKADLQEVLPAIETGHQLEAEGQHSVYGQSNIEPYWQQHFKIIDDHLAAMISAYQKGDTKAAKAFAQKAQYDGYKNSEMEMSVRLNRSAKLSGSINQQFYNLIKLSGKPNNMNELAYQTTLLLQDIEELLPNLPTTREDQKVDASDEILEESDDTENKDWSKIAKDIDSQLQQALLLAEKGENKLAMLSVQDTYFDVFEASNMEAKIGARDSQFKAQIEGYFTRLVSLIKAGEGQEVLKGQVDGLNAELAKAVAMLDEGSQDDWSLFLYSLMIILREGLEALLIVAAIVTYLVKNNHQDKLSTIRQSVYVALLASVVTAVIFQLIFSNAGASRELLEGFTMMIAVVMLFSMSYWLLSKVEANNWKRYLEGKLSHALTTGSLIGLWLTSFLAVYREGAETVLFYYALISDVQSQTGYLYLLAGFGVGVIALTFCYFIMRYSVVKLPLKPFFMFTGSFMYLMAFVFAGKSVLELIEGKLFEPTLLSGVPEISWLGIYPYVETLVPQAFLLMAAVVAYFVMKRQAK